MGDIRLPSRVRDNLHSLTSTQKILDKTNSRLSTGLKIQNAVDDPVKYFRSLSLKDRSDIFNDRRNDITQGIDALKTASHGIEALVKMVKAIKGQVSALRGADSDAQFASYMKTFNEMVRQYNNLAQDASYQGIGFLAGSEAKLTVHFSHDPEKKLTIQAKNELSSAVGLGSKFDSSGVGGTNKITGLNSGVSTIVHQVSYASTGSFVKDASRLDVADIGLDQMLNHLKADLADFGGSLSILNVRSDFTENYVRDLSLGSDDLVIADAQAEGANMMALQTRQSLALNSLSIAGVQDRNVLQLIRQ